MNKTDFLVIFMLLLPLNKHAIMRRTMSYSKLFQIEKVWLNLTKRPLFSPVLMGIKSTAFFAHLYK